jgi:hypothetical protein
MAVEKRHKVSLENKFSQLWHQGHCTLERWEISAWFGYKERITNVVWRSILEEWNEFAESDEYLIQVIRCDKTTTPQTFVLIQSNRLGDLTSMAE